MIYFYDFKWLKIRESKYIFGMSKMADENIRASAFIVGGAERLLHTFSEASNAMRTQLQKKFFIVGVCESRWRTNPPRKTSSDFQSFLLKITFENTMKTVFSREITAMFRAKTKFGGNANSKVSEKQMATAEDHGD